MRPEDICPHLPDLDAGITRPHSPAIYPASVWRCDEPSQADRMLAGQIAGYVYQRDGHPNGDQLAEQCRLLHAADRAAVTSSGMSALSAALLAFLRAGDHVVVGRYLYGKSQTLLIAEGGRLGIESGLADTCDLAAVEAAMRPNTRLIVVETIANPRLQVADIPGLAELAHRHNAWLLVDNTFATPLLCRPLELGADLVLESITKMMNGHSDVILGLLAGRAAGWERVPRAISAWGLASAPFECWLAARGLATLAVRMDRAFANAERAARLLASRREVRQVDYPGLEEHPQHALARRQLNGRFGSMVTFHLPGGTSAATAFLRAARRIPFCPSLGEVATTISHPESTSHRALTVAERAALGIDGGTLRLSVGIESSDYIEECLVEGLA
ncbi:MAG: trans-sulfuration enzyme family protein, partial [Planctomycetota bacterium]